ncbi:MAG: restriction endonuclease subunit S [Marinifilaceae bacterium]
MRKDITIKDGYQNTELGIIPIDWKKCIFADVLNGFSSGMTPYRGISEFYTGKISWITSGELNYNIITDTIEKITRDAVVKTNLKILPVGTFLMAITGLEAKGTRGRCAITGVKATTNQSCMSLFPKDRAIITEYLYHFYIRYGDELALKYCQGSKQQSYTGQIVRLLPINIPSIHEQRVIATVLSDMDSLIEKLDKIIDKKKLVKQGAMQELLTGKKRLPDFSNDWEVKRLHEIGKTYGGLTGKNKADFGNGCCSYISFLNVMNNVEIDINILERVDIKNGEHQNEVRKNDLFFNTSSETPHEVGMCAVLIKDVKNVYLNSFCFGFRLKTEDSVYGLFLSYLMNGDYGRFLMFSIAQGSTRYNLSKSYFNKLEIRLPKFTEQKAIAEVLIDMDKEIVILESKRVKYQKIKEGAMQELLTGKTRLI